MDWPAAYLRFIELFNAERFWDSHEALEDAWRETGSGFYHGLILFASAFVHVRRGNPHGIEAQLGKAADALEPFRPRHLGLDVDALLDHAARCRDVVARHRRDPDPDWAELVPGVRLAPQEALVRGDEPELEHG